MKTTLTLSYNGIICLLILFLTLQSCRVYKTDLYTAEEAVEIGKNVKIKMVNDKSYFFKKLTFENDELFGYAKKSSNAAEQLQEQIIPYDNDENLVKIALHKNDIKSVKIKDKAATIAVNVLGVLGGIAGFAYIAASNMTMDIDWSGN